MHKSLNLKIPVLGVRIIKAFVMIKGELVANTHSKRVKLADFRPKVDDLFFSHVSWKQM